MLVGGAVGLQLDHGWSMHEVPLEPIATQELVRRLFREGKLDEAYLRGAECVDADPTCRPLAIEVKRYLIDARPLEAKSRQQLEALLKRAISISGEGESKPVEQLRALLKPVIVEEVETAGVEPAPLPADAEKQAAQLVAMKPKDRAEALSIAMRVFYLTTPGSPLRQWAEHQLRSLKAGR